MWSQLLYIILLLACPLGQVKDHFVSDKQKSEIIISDNAVKCSEEICASWELEVKVYFSHNLWMSLAVGSQLDLPGDYSVCGNVACRALPVTKRVIPYNIDLSIRSSQYLRHLSSYYDDGIYILMRKLVI